MSFPTIPDINPVIDIDLCDAINLLLSSIAMEEISLSKLMDVEREKIEAALSQCTGGGGSLDDVIKVNNSADDMLKTMIKLQMLLQFKLESVRDLGPCKTTTTTTTTTTTSTTCTWTTTTQHCHSCCLMGTAKGCIENRCDSYFGQPVSVYTFIAYNDIENRTVRFIIGNETVYFYASGQDIQISCPDCSREDILVCGKGRLKVSQNKCEDLDGTGKFILTVRTAGCGRIEFRMQLFSCCQPCFEYDSGFITASSYLSDLRISV